MIPRRQVVARFKEVSLLGVKRIAAWFEYRGDFIFPCWVLIPRVGRANLIEDIPKFEIGIDWWQV